MNELSVSPAVVNLSALDGAGRHGGLSRDRVEVLNYLRLCYRLDEIDTWQVCNVTGYDWCFSYHQIFRPWKVTEIGFPDSAINIYHNANLHL